MAETKKSDPVPGHGADELELRKWLTRTFTVPDGGRIGEIVRYGGASRTPLTVEVVFRGGARRVVRLEEERDVVRNGALRQALTRDAGLNAAPLASSKVAGDAYYVICRLARVVGGVDPRHEILEWIDDFREAATRLELSLARRDLYATLDALRSYPYSKRHINLWITRTERGEITFGDEPRPPLVVDGDAEWTSITHLATYIRWGRDQAGAISSESLAGRVVELGGERWKVSAWDGTTRRRRRRITAVLVRLPIVEPDPDSADV